MAIPHRVKYVVWAEFWHGWRWGLGVPRNWILTGFQNGTIFCIASLIKCDFLAPREGGTTSEGLTAFWVLGLGAWPRLGLGGPPGAERPHKLDSDRPPEPHDFLYSFSYKNVIFWRLVGGTTSEGLSVSYRTVYNT